MRLLNTDDLTFREFIGSNIPGFSILSHTWSSDGDEVSFKEMRKRPPGVEERSGFRKIQEFAELNREMGHKWTWIDTCCIDKRSSAELSEAINSMYNWYWAASKCYVYLADFQRPDVSAERWSDETAKEFQSCKWFTRGWTLQELIAPFIVKFYDKNWDFIGTTWDKAFVAQISKASFLPEDLFGTRSRDKLSKYSIAQKMSWAARRQTTRPEDTAYCLLGLFDVNMPLLYGEGEKAFQRLQEELIKKSTDRSIFCWKDQSGDEFCFRGLFARCPAEFVHCNDIKIVPLNGVQHRKILPYSMTNEGLHAQVSLSRMNSEWLKLLGVQHRKDLTTKIYLWCLWDIERDNTRVGILLRRLEPDGMRFARSFTDRIIHIEDSQFSLLGCGNAYSFYAPDQISHPPGIAKSEVYGFWPKSVVHFKWQSLTEDEKIENLILADTLDDGSVVGAFLFRPDTLGNANAESAWVVVGYFPKETEQFRSSVIFGADQGKITQSLEDPLRSYLSDTSTPRFQAGSEEHVWKSQIRPAWNSICLDNWTLRMAFDRIVIYFEFY